jgi:hypothetical protein
VPMQVSVGGRAKFDPAGTARGVASIFPFPRGTGVTGALPQYFELGNPEENTAPKSSTGFCCK